MKGFGLTDLLVKIAVTALDVNNKGKDMKISSPKNKANLFRIQYLVHEYVSEEF